MQKPKWIFVYLILFSNMPGAGFTEENVPPPMMLAPVNVVGKKNEAGISATTLKTEEIKKVPGSANDPLRAVHVVPSVAIESDFDARLFIRGSAPEDSRVMIDNISAGFPFHFYGLAGTVDANILKEIEIISGGFPVEYGNQMGGIIALHSRSVDDTEAIFSLNLIQAGVYYRTPFLDKGFFQGSFRKGFYDLVLRNWQEAVLLPSYYDYFAQGGWDPLCLYTWGSEDSASIYTHLPSGAKSVAHLRQQAHHVALTYHYDQGDYELATLGHFFMEGQNYFIDNKNYFEQDPKSLQGSAQLRYRGWEHHRLLLGCEGIYQEPELNVRISDYFDLAKKYLSEGQAIFTADKIYYHTAAGYLSDHFYIAEKWFANLGLRCDYTSYNHKYYLSPRGQLEYTLHSQHRLRFAGGVYYQEPLPLVLAMQAADQQNLTYDQAIHYILSYEFNLVPGWPQILELYYKDFRNLTALSLNRIYSFDGKGYAKGLEYKMQCIWNQTSRTTFSYVWSESKRYLPEKQVWIFFDNDRTHQLTLLQQLDITPQFGTTLKWTYSTGQPYTSSEIQTADEINARRLPDYHRLDVRFQYHTKLDSLDLELYLDLFNLYNAENYSRIIFNNLYSSVTYFEQFPLLFILGMEIKL